MQGNGNGGKPDTEVIVIGGGLAGLTVAILLAKHKKRVLLIEKKSYPFHRVCGEYISNEVLPFLQWLGFDPFLHGASRLSDLRVSSPSGNNFYAKLDLGGFGISRYTMDNALYQLAVDSGVEILTETKVMDVAFEQNTFSVKTSNGTTYTTGLVVGSYGKRDTLDKKLNRDFIQTHTEYLGVKYHLRTDYPADEIGLDNFEGGYCGISRIEDGKYNLCYLYKRGNFKFKSIPELEQNVLYKNPVLKNIFRNSEFLFDKPEVINEISFDKKQLVENHILMCGDSAGLITPLCGNGMSMAIHSAKLLGELILETGILDKPSIPDSERKQLEAAYHKNWDKNFSRRLFWGRVIHKAFGNTVVTGMAIRGVYTIPKLRNWLISSTHGQAIAI